MTLLFRRFNGFLHLELDIEEIPGRAALADCTFLVGATVLSFVPYVRGLGFYYDDYSFLGLLSTSKDQSLAGLFRAISTGAPAKHLRPGQELILSALYWMFGDDPLPYHLVNAAVIVAMAVLFYLVLRELRLPRLVVVTVPLVYVLLPHYATDRFWYAAFQAPVSIALYFLSVLAALRSVRARTGPMLLWIFLSVSAVVGSALSYEVALPFFLLTPFLVWYRARQPGSERLRRQDLALPLGAYLAAFFAVVVWKGVAAQHLGNVSSYHLGYEGGAAHYAAYLVSGIVKLNFGTYGIGLPYVVVWILVHRFNWVAFTIALLLGLLTFAYLGRAGGTRLIPRPATARTVLFAGLVFFVLGYATFLTNSKILFRSAGIDNRVGIAAAVGIAMAVVGGVAWLAAALAGRLRTVFFRTAMAAAAATGTLIVETLAHYWTTARDRQDAIVADIKRQLPADPSGTQLISNGSCPEDGPAVVFATTTDLSGRLMMEYRDPTLQAAVVRDELRFGRDRATLRYTFLGSTSAVLEYPYGPKLFLSDARDRRLRSLGSAQDARRYRRQEPTDLSCPALRSFAWGIKISRWFPLD